jgi:hypothetical protein
VAICQELPKTALFHEIHALILRLAQVVGERGAALDPQRNGDIHTIVFRLASVRINVAT